MDTGIHHDCDVEIALLQERIAEFEAILKRIIARPMKESLDRAYESWYMGYDDSTVVARLMATEAFVGKE